MKYTLIESPELRDSTPLVSVKMITYNHAPFIEEAILSVVTQNTDFLFELVIGEDCSTDNTRDILLKLQKEYPNIIRLVLNNENMGMFENGRNTMSLCRGKYIALCEGDDYWTNVNKLQKQTDFLENNPKYSLCFHNAEMINVANNSSKLFRSSKKNRYSTKDVILNRWFCPTASILFKRDILEDFPYNKKIVNGDLLMLFIASLHGNFHYIDEVMSAYRYGVIGSVSNRLNSKGVISLYRNLLNYLNYINNYTRNRFIVYIMLKKIYIYLAIFKNVIIQGK